MGCTKSVVGEVGTPGVDNVHEPGMRAVGVMIGMDERGRETVRVQHKIKFRGVSDEYRDTVYQDQIRI